MLSIGEIIDKLIIENIKIATIKEKLNASGVKEGDAAYVEMYQRMMDLNTNRGIIAQELDAKIARVMAGEKNRLLKTVKTYG